MPKTRYFASDFETTVYENQDHTEVWASACVELHTEDVIIYSSIDEQFAFYAALNCNVCAYYHNLKFDGAFWLDYFLRKKKFKQAYYHTDKNHFDGHWIDEKDMENETFKYTISNMGQWYSIVIKINNKIIEFRDSLKLLPFSLEKIGKNFQTKHKKLSMEYEGYRYSGCVITEREREYISNDVLVLKEALEIMFEQGHNSMTIGTCCLREFKRGFDKQDYNAFFPNLYEYVIDERYHKHQNAGEWVRKSYKGGWCYYVEEKANRILSNGTTADVNSLYPSMMSSESGNYYPIGKPTFWVGEIPYVAKQKDIYFFVRIKTRFRLKDGYLPFIQIKDNKFYKGTECLKTSDIYNPKTGQYYDCYRDSDGNIHPAKVELTLTMTDYYLILEHYDLYETEYIDGCWFHSQIGIFDEYIEKYKKIKISSTGAIRELAKLFLNNLYGKMASNTNSSFKYAELREDGSIGFLQVPQNEKEPGYIPIGSAITSYARNFTIRAAQKNYYGADKRGFVYADTDSIHCDLEPHEIKGITVHDKNFCCWKIESCWDVGYFCRQKTYIEHITHEDLKPIEKPYYNVKCAGMPERCKILFIQSMEGIMPTDEYLTKHKYTKEDIEFIKTKRTIEDFKIGLSVPGKLKPKRIKGGVILAPTPYVMRAS